MRWAEHKNHMNPLFPLRLGLESLVALSCPLSHSSSLMPAGQAEVKIVGLGTYYALVVPSAPDHLCDV